MHELFTQVLNGRDLSRAGDLFSVPDREIVADLTEVVSGRTTLFCFLNYQMIHPQFMTKLLLSGYPYFLIGAVFKSNVTVLLWWQKTVTFYAQLIFKSLKLSVSFDSCQGAVLMLPNLLYFKY